MSYTAEWWIDRIISHYDKKNDFKMWSNLSDLQRKILTKDFKNHLIEMYNLGVEETLDSLNELTKKEILKQRIL